MHPRARHPTSNRNLSSGLKHRRCNRLGRKVGQELLEGPLFLPGLQPQRSLVSPTIAEPCRDTIDGKLDPTQHLLVDAARSVLLQELDLDVVQRIQVREPVPHRTIEQRIILQELAIILTASRVSIES